MKRIGNHAIFSYAYGSGHFSQSAASLKRWLTQAMSVSSLVAGTEVYGKRRTSELAEPGWAYHSGKDGDADQLYVCWHLAEWTVIGKDEVVITDQQYVREGGATAPKNELLITVLRHNATGFVLAHLLGHFPAGVEGHGGPFGFYNTLQTRVGVSVAAFRGVKRVKREVKRQYHPDAIMFGGDTNLNQERTAVRVFFKALFPRAVLNFKSFTGPGTLGKRFIDVFFCWRLEVVSNPVVRDSAASDHRWYHQSLAFTSRRPTAGRP